MLQLLFLQDENRQTQRSEKNMAKKCISICIAYVSFTKHTVGRNTLLRFVPETKDVCSFSF